MICIRRKIEIDKDGLVKLYGENKFSTYKIAEILGCSSSVIKKRLKLYSIKARPSVEPASIPENELRDIYINRNRSVSEISKIYYYNNSTIYRLLKKYNISIKRKISKVNIPKRDLEEHFKNGLSAEKIAKLYGCSGTKVCSLLYDYGLRNKQKRKIINIYKKELINLYVEKKLKTNEIAKLYNCKSGAIVKRLHRYKIPMRRNNYIKIPKKKLENLYYERGLNLGQIAKKLNICLTTVSSRFKEYGLKPLEKNYKIKLPKNKLIKLYTKDRITIREISKRFGCSYSTICNRLRFYDVKINSKPLYKDIPKDLLNELYAEKKLSTHKIARKLNCSKNVINNRLKWYNIKIRNHSEAGKSRTDFKEKYLISAEELNDLYHNKKLSIYQIARIYNCSPSAIFYKMKKYKIHLRELFEAINLTIPRRSRSVARAAIRYPKKEFSHNLLEKSYLLGFAIGDLYVSKRKYGATIGMGTSTTKKVQVDLLKRLFGRYTHLSVRKNNNQYQISCNLDMSFNFLLDYKKDIIPEWVLNDKNIFLSFFAGYIDAEGYFGINRNIGEFRVGSYDKGILFGISEKLREFNIVVEGPKVTVKKGHIDKRGVRWNNDMWEIRIRRMRELYNFISFIKSYIKHKKRFKNMVSVERSLLRRNRRIRLNEEKILFNNPCILP